jgi:3-oxoacyl-[acyl-carrier-protein] synthase-3
LFALALADTLAAQVGEILVVGAEKLSAVLAAASHEPGTGMLFGDGAGACLVSRERGFARILEHVVHSDGAFAGDLRLELQGPLQMNGKVVILQASRKIPRAIEEVLARSNRAAAEVTAFLMHQANKNLITRVAQSLAVPADRFFSNIERYGNTSSASMLIAAAEWHQSAEIAPGDLLCFAAFGAGFHWGALLAEVVAPS